jgi:alkylation response protein AidB-like acyl-CoA dehydrogenase
MSAPTFLAWPFFGAEHRDLAAQAQAWTDGRPATAAHEDIDLACRQLVDALGAAGLLRYCVPRAYGGALDHLDSRALCLLRETLAHHDALADFAFAMQGLGSGAITLAGTEAQRRTILPGVASGESIMAFALSEPGAGSDAAALACAARRDGAHWVLDGEKTWISNGGIADWYTVFARTGDGHGAQGISAFLVPAHAAGLHIAERIDVIAPHPLARIVFDGCRVPAAYLLGEAGLGFRLALATLDIFRASVAAAAVGMAQRALDETLVHARNRPMFGGRLAELPVAQSQLADMATHIDAARLLTYRAAWQHDVTGTRTTREAAMAKLTATESAQRVIDTAVQLFGALGVRRGSIVERLYREIRALRIYEGASEVQRLVIARDLLKESSA